MDPLVRLEGEGLGVGMAMMPIEPGMRTVRAIAAPLRSGVMSLGCLSGISRVLPTYLPHVDLNSR